MPGTKEIHMLEMERYRTPQGKPTCAIDFECRGVCEFYATQRFGTSETCLLAPNDDVLLRSDGMLGKGMGYLIPGKWCPVWNDKSTNESEEE